MGTGGQKELQLFSKHLKGRIYKIKQHGNYILIIINQNPRSKLKGIIKSVQNFMKSFKPRRQLPKLGTMGVAFRTGMIFAMYKNSDEKDIENY